MYTCKPCELNNLENKQHADFYFSMLLHLGVRKVLIKNRVREEETEDGRMDRETWFGFMLLHLTLPEC